VLGIAMDLFVNATATVSVVAFLHTPHRTFGAVAVLNMRPPWRC
jgi:hypothetical protein